LGWASGKYKKPDLSERICNQIRTDALGQNSLAKTALNKTLVVALFGLMLFVLPPIFVVCQQVQDVINTGQPLAFYCLAIRP
jgi:hypothetical protein